MFNRKPRFIVVAFVGLVLAGCSISPDPFDQQEIIDSAQRDAALINLSQEPLVGELDLSEAMARAVKFNLENRLQLMQQVLAESSYDLLKMDMLPMLAANAGYTDRSNVDASRSFNIITQTDNFTHSTSQDQEYVNGDIRFAWNVLDFGVSYFQAQQEGDRFLASGLGRQKIMLRILEETRGAYWRAVAMKSVESELETLLNDARASLARLQEIRASQLQSPLTTLQDTRSLIELVQQLEEMQQAVSLSNIELSTLINEPPGSVVRLEIPDELPDLPNTPDNIEALELTALANSADYVSEMYNLRVDQLESRKSMMRLLPGLEFSYGANYNDNSFLFHDNWGQLGVRLTGNLMRLMSRNSIKEQNLAREAFAEARKLTVNMAVLTQLHLAWQQFANTRLQLERAEQLNLVDQDISRITRQSRSANASTGIAEIQTRARALRSRMSEQLAFAGAQASFGSFMTSLSLDPIPVDYQLMSVEELANHLHNAYEDWERGDIPNYGAAMVAVTTEPDQVEVAPLSVPVRSVIEENINSTIGYDAATLEAEVADWLASWENQDVEGYFSHYHPEYPVSGTETRSNWQRLRRQRLTSPASISIDYDNFDVVSANANNATVRFSLTYRTPSYSDQSLKELYLYSDGDDWKISIEETVAVSVMR